MHPNVENHSINNVNGLLPWKIYLTVAAETLVAFFLAAFSLCMFIMHPPIHWVLPAVMMVLLFIFVIIVCIIRVFQRLPISAVMLIIPIAPLIALIMVVSLIPVIQYLQL